MSPARLRRSRDFLIGGLLAVLSAGFVVAFSARPTVILSTAGADDALFMRLGASLASGEWLGAYNHMTLVKGMGFPAFLAMSNLSGLPYLLSLSLFHLACVAFAAWTLWRWLGSRLAASALFVLLLLAPIFYFGDLTRVFRDFFYMSQTLALTAAVIALATRPASRLGAVGVGLLGGWWWLTREEGVWLLPTLALIAAAALLTNGPPRLKRLVPFVAASAVAALIVVLVGGLNAAVYGRFVVNEIKDSAFQGALDALQEASAPHARSKVLVPRAAREEIYAVSPAFARLRNPVLDGPMWEQHAAAGCQADPNLCGDIGGGWFMWVLREAAAADGQHQNPAKAASFYRRIEREVRSACAGGRLSCKSWDAPLVPPIRADELDDIAASVGRSLEVLAFTTRVFTGGLRSDMSAPDAQMQYRFLNRPHHQPRSAPRGLAGWFVGDDEEWFELAPGPQVTILKLERQVSPDIAIHFGRPGLDRQRFALEVDCQASDGCPVELRRESGRTHALDLATLSQGGVDLGDARLYIDAVEGEGAEGTLLKDRFSRAWVGFAARLNPLYAAVLGAGLLAFLVVLAQDLVRRRLSATLVVAAALLAGAAARVVIVSLIDALSFPAANHVYLLAAVPLLLLFAVISIHAAVRGLLRQVQLRPPNARISSAS